MISNIIIDDHHPPSDPSSSSHHHQIQQNISNDIKVSYIDLKSLDVDLDDIINNQLPKFSIRDYVSGLRSKDIGCNWPFSPTSLQLCLKHGVKNLLPPFQSLDSLRNNSSLTRCSSFENLLTDEELVSSLDCKLGNDQSKTKEKLPLKSITTNSSVSKGQKSKEKPPSSFSQKTENASIHIKKSRLVMKLNSGVERVEDIVPNNFIVSETMASKVCPVCKIFSSSSNTTLNAHIDQCLTGEGTMKWTENPKVIVKYKVKPRKMRLMVDIYKTARHCTVEELDRRNGISWATNSSFPDQECQFQGEEEDKEEDEEEKEKEEEEKEKYQRPATLNPEEEKKERKTTNIVISKVANNEGDVYIDTNGTKFRILSVPKASSLEKNRARKLVKGVKGSKVTMGKKKNYNYKQKHQQKHCKVIRNAQKLCSPKPQATSGQGEAVAMAENFRKDKPCREPMKLADLAITRPPWACSKRTGLLKKFSGKKLRVESKSHEMKDLLVESERSFSECDLGTPQSSFDKVPYSQIRKKLRSSSLSRQPLRTNKIVEFGKEDICMQSDDDDNEDNFDDCGSPDAIPSQYSDGADKSTDKKMQYLDKNISFPAAKINLKRKFTALGKSRVCGLLNNVSGDGPSQDSLEEQSNMEEHPASKSSNEESSEGIQSVNGDELESVRNETLLSNVDQVCILPAPSFMDLSSTFNAEFSKQERIGLYEDQLCSTNRAPDDVEKQENYFQEVDPIPIPGPPGSFLPASPGGEMVTEEHIQTNRVLSNENQHLHDTMDHDSMSNSPVSTVSNSRSTSVQDDAYKRSFVNGDMGFTERGLSHNSFKNDQPCCCSRKEVAFNYQDSCISRKQPVEPNRSIPSAFDFKPEMFPPPNNYSASPVPGSAVSPSKPVLRLMGKNLTVAKTDEDEYRQPQSSQQHPQLPVIFSHKYQNGNEYHDFNVHTSSTRRSHVDLQPIHGGFLEPMDHYDHGGPYLGPADSQARSYHGHNILDFQAVGGTNVYNVTSSSKSVDQEIIIIDDSPEIEADDCMRNEYLKKNQKQMNPVYPMYPSQRSTHPYGGGGGGGNSSLFHDGRFQNWTNGDLGKWSIRSGQSSSLSPSMAHLRSSPNTYYPPSYP
uniref:uncharacterized protein LOC122590928 n=1 Tax=Erigeron canadensis TaxID=72917 RepID=UPI001CB8BB09|nr:uncharacterized protein LOC122590928 [Erigeron canadensis]